MDRFDRYREEIDINEVPEHLRDLVPFAYKWGIGDDIARSDFEESSSDEEKEELRRALSGRTEQVSEWLDSFAENSVHPGAFSNFCYVLEAVAEMTIWPD
ncbi:MAG: hypothetical protein WB799_08280 [Candidatus Sulfotelmatobacter sp.]